MSDLEFIVAFALLFVAALVGHITKSRWQKQDDHARTIWEDEEAARSYRHDEPSQVGPVQNQHLGLMRFLAWAFTAALCLLVLARYSAVT